MAVLDAEAARVSPIPVAAVPEDRLSALVVPIGLEAEVDQPEVVVPVRGPAGQGPRLLANIVLGVGGARSAPSVNSSIISRP